MSSNHTVTKETENHRLIIERTFDDSRIRLWEAWSNERKLTIWWGPGQWPASSKSFDFRPGGHWHYKMTGPDGTESWSWIDYKTIDAPNSLTAEDRFSDAEGNKSTDMPAIEWEVVFSGEFDGPTTLTTTLTFSDQANMQKVIDMGFEAGYTQALDQLSEMLFAT